MPDEEFMEKVRALLLFVEETKGSVSNVHDNHDHMSDAVDALEKALKPCECEYCVKQE